jgi:slime mold repeat-containing protein
VCYFVATSCDDGNSCTLDSCDPASGACGQVALADDSACDDADACSLNDVCTAGVCGGAAVVCEDDDPCTTGVCDSASGQCSYPSAPCAGDGDGDGVAIRAWTR